MITVDSMLTVSVTLNNGDEILGYPVLFTINIKVTAKKTESASSGK